MIFNFGSINIDQVYRVSEMPQPGETLAAKSHEKFLGGKGVNQSVAIAKAGGAVTHIGAVGEDGGWALGEIEKLGVSTETIAKLDCPTGHAIIFVDDQGENQIVIAGAANQELTQVQIDTALDAANPETDWVLLQNETNFAAKIVASAKSKSLRIAYAAAPFVAETTLALIDKIDLLAVNEGEAAALAAALNTDPANIPVPKLLITKGSSGAEFREDGKTIIQNAFPVDAVDTTGAGDTFLGSFLALYAEDGDAKTALRYATGASALQVTRTGAAPAIPEKAEILEFLKDQT